MLLTIWLVDPFEQFGVFPPDPLVELVQRRLIGQHDQVDVLADIGDPGEIVGPAGVDLKERDLLLHLAEDLAVDARRKQLVVAVFGPRGAAGPAASSSLRIA